MTNMFDLTGKKALVTGASRGIGKGIALALAKAGADIAVNYHSKQEEAEAVVAEIKSMGRDAVSIHADTSNQADVTLLIEKAIAGLGGIDILVNNAGVLGGSPVQDMAVEEWDRVLNVNARGYFLVAKEVAGYLIKNNKPGRIINIASIASGQTGIGAPNASNYDASKGAVIAFSESIAAELAPKGIRVNTIAPGLIETDMVAGITSNPETLKGFLAHVPMGRVGKPEDIGAAAVFLASDEAAYVCGTVLYVDGGYLTL